MRRDEFLTWLKGEFPGVRFDHDPVNPNCLVVPTASVPAVLERLRDAEASRMQFLEYVTAVDCPEPGQGFPQGRISLVYSLYSYEHRHRLALKVHLPRENPTLPSAVSLWENADWNEREVYDLFGVFFTGHPDLRRIMMPEDWEGHPLRKDYSHPNLALKPD